MFASSFIYIKIFLLKKKEDKKKNRKKRFIAFILDTFRLYYKVNSTKVIYFYVLQLCYWKLSILKSSFDGSGNFSQRSQFF